MKVNLMEIEDLFFDYSSYESEFYEEDIAPKARDEYGRLMDILDVSEEFLLERIDDECTYVFEKYIEAQRELRSIVSTDKNNDGRERIRLHRRK